MFRNETTGKTEGLANRAVDLLAAQFLLRTELRAGGAWVELVHDRFIDPILQSNQAWLDRNQNPMRGAAQAWEEAARTSQAVRRQTTGRRVAEVQTKPADFSELEQEFVGAGQEATPTGTSAVSELCSCSH